MDNITNNMIKTHKGFVQIEKPLITLPPVGGGNKAGPRRINTSYENFYRIHEGGGGE